MYSAKIDLIKNKAGGLVLIQLSNNNIELSDSLEDETGNKIQRGYFIYSDEKDQTLWRCQFAPPKSGKYNIIIFAEEKMLQIKPLNGVLQNGSTVHFRCRIPSAQEVNITVDDN
ncbi:unnamed protein product [Rotaria sp. Silwood1]|nr:unnamed protein product [Rotaria sp. Silwood1]CAF4562628.1 unnamed protein product [Rotaria sp. Silwood1]